VIYKTKYEDLQEQIKNHYVIFEVPYNGTDKNYNESGAGFTPSENPEKLQYYYHSDHLGSSNLITDILGEVVQHIEYVPFGEVFIEEKNNKWNTPYLFNAKELDEETGLYYYGARYYDPRVSVWYGVDPKWEEYPNITPYAYCLNNPVKLVDPDGQKAMVIVKGNTITVSAVIQVYGRGATNTGISNIKSSINNHWAKQSNGANWTYTDPANGDVYNVVMDVSVKKRNILSIGRTTDNYIKVDPSVSRSYVRNGSTGEWGTGDSWVPAHEFAHLVGIDDRYADNANGISVANTGWQGNIMGSYNGTVDQRNIDAMVGDAMRNLNTKKNDVELYNQKVDQMKEKRHPFSFLLNKKPVPGVDSDFKYKIDVKSPSN